MVFCQLIGGGGGWAKKLKIFKKLNLAKNKKKLKKLKLKKKLNI